MQASVSLTDTANAASVLPLIDSPWPGNIIAWGRSWKQPTTCTFVKRQQNSLIIITAVQMELLYMTLTQPFNWETTDSSHKLFSRLQCVPMFGCFSSRQIRASLSNFWWSTAANIAYVTLQWHCNAAKYKNYKHLDILKSRKHSIKSKQDSQSI